MGCLDVGCPSPQDDVTVWQFQVDSFDDDTPGGRQLNADLRQLAAEHKQGFLLMEARFPEVGGEGRSDVLTFTVGCD